MDTEATPTHAGRCWSDFAYPESRCNEQARWRTPPDLCAGIGEQFMRTCQWCDKHRQANDVLIEAQE